MPGPHSHRQSFCLGESAMPLHGIFSSIRFVESQISHPIRCSFNVRMVVMLEIEMRGVFTDENDNEEMG